jgi:CDP-paratose 2-epimerase
MSGLSSALITGGAGFIGSNLARRLLDSGTDVTVYDNLARPGVERNLAWLLSRYPALRFEHADVRDRARLAAAVAGADMVFHLAAQVAVTTSIANPREDFLVNLEGTMNVLEAIRETGRPIGLVFTSTNKVYGALGDLPVEEGGARHFVGRPDAAAGIDETRCLDFHSPYGCSKGAADQYVLDYARTYGLRAAVFRMSCIYGPHQHGTEDQGWVAHFLIQALRHAPVTVFGDGKQVRDLLYVEDLLDAFVAAAQSIDAIAGQAFNIGGGPENTLSLRELLDYIAGATGRPPAVSYDSWRQGDQRWYVSDPRKFGRATGWSPRTGVEEGLQLLLRWLAENSLTRGQGVAV